MLEHEEQSGASRPNVKIKGQLLGIFADLKSTYGLERLELAWLVMMALEGHIQRHEGLEDWVRFTEQLSKMSSETLSKIDDILLEDAKAHKRYH